LQLTSGQLAALERPGPLGEPAWRLATILASLESGLLSPQGPEASSLRDLALAFYRISSLSNNATPGRYPLPADALREFMASGVVHSNYFSGRRLAPEDFSDEQQYQARRAVTNLLSAIPPRPLTSSLMRVRADTFDPSCTRLDLQTGGVASLFHPGGVPFRLLAAFQLAPGSLLQVTGFTDASPRVIPRYCATNLTWAVPGS
jgi:hypothetical protein